MIRKTVVATAIIGAGLGSMSGAAFAGEAPHHGDNGKSHSSDHKDKARGGDQQRGTERSSGNSCSNAVAAENSNSSGRSLGDTVGGSQDLSASNLCHILSGNEILNNANVAVLGGAVRDGDDITRTDTRTSERTITGIFG